MGGVEGLTSAQSPLNKDGSQPSQSMRQRRPERPPTIVEDEAGDVRAPAQARRIPRRSSSFMTESSVDERSSMRSSTDDLLLPRATGEEEEIHQEPSLWYSFPLLFAIVPAVGGVVFKKGSVLVTDLALLVLAAIYLNWCLVTPWIWYESARTIRVVDASSPTTTVDGDEDDSSHNRSRDDMNDIGANENGGSGEEQAIDQNRRDAAKQELQVHEVLALAFCFAGPMLGACVLHLVRARLSHSVDELVSNLHLSLFVLGAELRPLRHMLKMVQKRTLHLQKTVREHPYTVEKADSNLLRDVESRLNEMDARISDAKVTNQPSVLSPAITSSVESLRKSQATLQNQIDALNRAVRRYEKRATAQSIQTEARLNGLEDRLKDALSLAAAAASYSQKPGVIYTGLKWTSQTFALSLEAIRAVALYPVHLGAELLLWILTSLRLVRRIRRRNPYQKTSTPRRSSKDRPVLKVPRTEHSTRNI